MIDDLLSYLFLVFELACMAAFLVRFRLSLPGLLGATAFGLWFIFSVARQVLVHTDIEWWEFNYVFSVGYLLGYCLLVPAILTAPRGARSDAAPAVSVAAPAGLAEGAYPLADRGMRLLAQLVDTLVMLVVLTPAGIAFLAHGNSRDVPVLGILLLLVGFLGLLVIQLVLLTTSGQTIGKRTVGVRIVMLEDQRNPGFVGAVLLRAFLPGLISAVPILGTLFSLVDVLFIFRDDRRCVHDLIAGTQVVTAGHALEIAKAGPNRGGPDRPRLDGDPPL